jgi:D-xylose transport system ATP-binding protein
MLELRSVSKSYGPVKALTGVDFCVNAGEVMALVGDNGAGKSTLIKVIAGAHTLDSGTVTMAGHPAVIRSPKDSQALGIATVFQDLALCDNLSVVSNLFLGAELTHAGALDELEMEQRTVELVRSLGMKVPDVRALVGALSGGQRQSVAIARALLGAPKVVVLDEPTAALGVEQTALVLNLVQKLREQGLGVVLISHNMGDVLSVADRITVLRLGRNAGLFDARDSSRESLIAAITGADQTIVRTNSGSASRITASLVPSPTNVSASA